MVKRREEDNCRPARSSHVRFACLDYVALDAELADTMAVAEKEPNTALTQAKT